jgi:hypothetical protein
MYASSNSSDYNESTLYNFPKYNLGYDNYGTWFWAYLSDPSMTGATLLTAINFFDGNYPVSGDNDGAGGNEVGMRCTASCTGASPGTYPFIDDVGGDPAWFTTYPLSKNTWYAFISIWNSGTSWDNWFFHTTATQSQCPPGQIPPCWVKIGDTIDRGKNISSGIDFGLEPTSGTVTGIIGEALKWNGTNWIDIYTGTPSVFLIDNGAATASYFSHPDHSSHHDGVFTR